MPKARAAAARFGPSTAISAMPPRTVSAPAGVLTLTPGSVFDSLPPTNLSAPLEACDEFASFGRGIVDEFVDDEARAGTDREGRAVQQQHLHHARTGRVDALVVDDGLRLFKGTVAHLARGLWRIGHRIPCYVSAWEGRFFRPKCWISWAG